MTKYIFVTGGVVSGLGKGIAAASIGLILKNLGLKVVNQKFDPYLNIDPGTMNPIQHGEVFVTDDGAETDLDLGHYERFTDTSLSQSSNTTAGRVYLTVLNMEREGKFHGGTVQVIPNITEEIKRRMLLSTKETNADVIITEIGGTIGDIESLPFVEAIRQIKYEVGEENCCYIHLTLVPYIATANELKTKPTQHSVKELHELGIIPNIIMLRTEHPIDDQTREKLANFCNVDPAHIIQNLNARSIYEVPLQLEKEGLGKAVCTALGIKKGPADLSEWIRVVERFNNPTQSIKIALVGKYVALHDAYLSVVESLIHGGIENLASIDIDWVSSEDLTDDEATEKRLKDADAVIVPGGFGGRGIEGMINTAKYCRTHNVPYFGICLGMQIAVIEYARNVLGIHDANSGEFDEFCPHKVIDFMPGQSDEVDKGGTLRLGSYPCVIKPDTVLAKLYESTEISERHRHRYEFNNDYRERYEKAGLTLAGTSPDGRLIETIELSDRPFYIGVQYHPEFGSRPNRAHPLFQGFIGAAFEKSREK